MRDFLEIAIVGDYFFKSELHQGTRLGLEDVAEFLEFDMNYHWVSTKELEDDTEEVLSKFHGVFIAPGPYRSSKGMVNAIEYARERDVPMLATSGGFQFVILEFLKNVVSVQVDLKTADQTKEEQEEKPAAFREEKIYITPDSQISKLYQTETTKEVFTGNLEVNGELRSALLEFGYETMAIDNNGNTKILSYARNEYFCAAQYLPQLKCSVDLPHPLIIGFLKAANALLQKKNLMMEV